MWPNDRRPVILPAEVFTVSDSEAADHEAPRPSVFLSYASDDREAARALRDALPAFGLEPWYDESELGGGEAWDQKIRRQIRECDYFMPLVSAQTEARLEGYFRREWRLAVERTLDMADDHLFLLPIVIDDTDQASARVPERFLTVQWLKVPGGKPTQALEALCRRVASGKLKDPKPSRKALRARGKTNAAAAVQPLPEFPQLQPGQRLRFYAELISWAARSVWVLFWRLPRWIRILAYIWLAITLISRCSSSKHEHSADISPAKVDKLKEISQHYQGSLSKGDVIDLGARIAKEFADDAASPAAGALLAMPFTAPAGDAAGEKLADSAFAMAYGMASISHPGQIGLNKDPLASRELKAALDRGRTSHATYVLYGTVDTLNGADPAKIATDVAAKIPPLGTN
jgi:hypothetical protein